MEANFVPECYFDTVLVKAILKTNKRLNHKHGCDNVVKELNGGKLRDDFAVGIIDKDKRELDYVVKECSKINRTDNLILWKHPNQMHFFIQLVPAIETWIINTSKESKINLEEFGLSNNLKKLKKLTKRTQVAESEDLQKLCKAVIAAEGKTITTLSKWLNHLYEHHRNADINVLKEDV